MAKGIINGVFTIYHVPTGCRNVFQFRNMNETTFTRIIVDQNYLANAFLSTINNYNTEKNYQIDNSFIFVLSSCSRKESNHRPKYNNK